VPQESVSISPFFSILLTPKSPILTYPFEFRKILSNLMSQ